MPRKLKKRRATSARAQSNSLRPRPCEEGLRLLPHSVPDLRDPRVRADLRRQGRLLAQHPENDAIDAWIEAVYDWSEFR